MKTSQKRRPPNSSTCASVRRLTAYFPGAEGDSGRSAFDALFK